MIFISYLQFTLFNTNVNKNRASHSFGLSTSPFHHNPHHTPQNPPLQQPIHDKDTQITTLTISSASEPVTSTQTKPTNYFIISNKINCEKEEHITHNRDHRKSRLHETSSKQIK